MHVAGPEESKNKTMTISHGCSSTLWEEGISPKKGLASRCKRPPHEFFGGPRMQTAGPAIPWRPHNDDLMVVLDLLRAKLEPHKT